jgi:hypothetical protein
VMSSPADSRSPEPGATPEFPPPFPPAAPPSPAADPEPSTVPAESSPSFADPAAPPAEAADPPAQPADPPAQPADPPAQPAVPPRAEQPGLDVAPDSELAEPVHETETDHSIPPELSPEPSPVSEPSPLSEPAPIEIDAGPFQLGEATEDERTHEAANRRKLRTVLMAGLLVVALGGAGTLAYVGWQVNTQRHTTLSVPATIGSLTLDDSEDATATADYLRSAISAEITMDKAVGAVYTTNDDKNVLFFGGTRLLWSPDNELESAFTLLGDEEGTVTGIEDVDAGELGGTMQCGVTKSDGTDLQVCGWADHGSLAVAMFLDRTATEAAGLMKDIRNATQTRG